MSEPRRVDRDALEVQLRRVEALISDDNVGLFGPDSLMWRIGRCYLPAVLGAGRALLLQVAHPWVTQGVDHHSSTRLDPIGRARRTFSTVVAMTLGSRQQAFAAARGLHRVHEHIRGTMEQAAGPFVRGSEYFANELHALMWVHATLWDSLVEMYELIVSPLTGEEKQRFYDETKRFAQLFGIPPETLPVDWNAFREYNVAMWASDVLTVTPAAVALKRDLFKPLVAPLAPLMRWGEHITAATLPPRLARDFDLPVGPRSQAHFERAVCRFRSLHRHLPDRFRYSPPYFEALARIRARRADPLTRLLNRVAFGRWVVVGRASESAAGASTPAAPRQ